MTTDENKKNILQLFNEGIARRNFAVVEALIAPDFVNHGVPGAEQGPEGFKGVINQFFDAFPDMSIHVEDVIAEGDSVATRGYWKGTHSGTFMNIPATGKQVAISYVDFWKVKNGKYTENWVQMDIAGLMQQLGVLPS